MRMCHACPLRVALKNTTNTVLVAGRRLLGCVHAGTKGSQGSNSSSGDNTASSKPADGEEEGDPAVPSHPGMKELQVRASSAFDAPDVLSMFVGEMRQQAQDLQATIATLVAPKAAVSFPQVGGPQVADLTSSRSGLLLFHSCSAV